MNTQLSLVGPAVTGHCVSDHEIARLISVLRGRGWQTAAQILALMDLPVTEDGRRWVRRVAHASRGQVASGPGSPGYALTCELSPQQMLFVEGMRTQIREMAAHYRDILRTWHRRPGAAVNQ
jgi:hypothetical protein